MVNKTVNFYLDAPKQACQIISMDFTVGRTKDLSSATQAATVEWMGISHFPHNNFISLPLYSCRIAAGIPSPADDGIENTLDLNEYLIQAPAATFFVRVQGDSMQNAGIYDGDLLIVDRSLTACSGKIIIAALNSELTVKRLKQENQEVWLMPENPAYQPIQVTEDLEFHIWGVVTNVIHSV